MRSRIYSMLGVTFALVVLATGASAKEVVPLLGGLLIDGYDFQNDIGPKGCIAFDEEKGLGSYEKDIYDTPVFICNFPYFISIFP